MQKTSNLTDFLNDDSGATAIEYGLIAALISIVILAGMRLLATAMDGMYSTVTTTVDDAISRSSG